MPVNRFVHFSDWVIGHSHLAMIGFASFIALGGLLHCWRLTPGCRYNHHAADWSFWLLTLGLVAMVLDLTTAGLVQGQLWSGDLPWMESVRASGPFWWVRSVAGVRGSARVPCRRGRGNDRAGRHERTGVSVRRRYRRADRRR